MTRFSDRLQDHAQTIQQESLAPGGWAMPHKGWVRFLRRVGWPHQTVVIALPTRGHVGKLAQQPVTVFPENWLKELARRLDIPWKDACRGRILAEDLP